MAERPLHPKHGPHQPRSGTPARRPGSVRRTTSHVAGRPEGLLGPVHLEAAGRDLWTDPAGEGEVLADATVSADFNLADGSVLRSLAVDPGDDRFAQLVGQRLSAGFRRALDRAVPDEDRAASLRYQLLDDFPNASLIAGFAIAAAGLHPPKGHFRLSDKADICAGWATGATILVEGEELGYPPQVTGPPAPDLLTGDRSAWHSVPGSGPHSMRRLRCIDVWPDGDRLEVEAFFRDSHIDGDGAEWVVHEYLLSATAETGTLVFTESRAETGVLPWVECPGALASAGRLIGTGAADLRERVRHDFVGTSTCTHLNDTMRALAALPFLARRVGARPTVLP